MSLQGLTADCNIRNKKKEIADHAIDGKGGKLDLNKLSQAGMSFHYTEESLRLAEFGPADMMFLFNGAD